MLKDNDVSLAVIIPVFVVTQESRDFLLRALDSISKQNRAPDEVILSLDFPKSSDPFFEEIRAKFPGIPIRVIDNERGAGISTNSNFGISASSGTLIHVLHQDDWLINPDAYSQIIQEHRAAPNSFWLLTARRLGEDISPTFDCTALLGNNRFGGPSGVIFPQAPGIRFNEKLSMLCDVELVYRLIQDSVVPRIIVNPSIEYGVSQDQAQNHIGVQEFRSELNLVFSQNKIHRLHLLILAISRYPPQAAYGILKNLETVTNRPLLKILIKSAYFYCRIIISFKKILLKDNS